MTVQLDLRCRRLHRGSGWRQMCQRQGECWMCILGFMRRKGWRGFRIRGKVGSRRGRLRGAWGRWGWLLGMRGWRGRGDDLTDGVEWGSSGWCVVCAILTLFRFARAITSCLTRAIEIPSGVVTIATYVYSAFFFGRFRQPSGSYKSTSSCERYGMLSLAYTPLGVPRLAILLPLVRLVQCIGWCARGRNYSNGDVFYKESMKSACSVLNCQCSASEIVFASLYPGIVCREHRIYMS